MAGFIKAWCALLLVGGVLAWADPVRGFQARMEGTTTATTSDSRKVEAAITGQTNFVPGVAGQALHLEKCALSFPAVDTISLETGAVSFWLRPLDWGDEPINFLPVFAVDSGLGSGWKLLLYYHHDNSGAMWDFRALTPKRREIICQMPLQGVLRRGEWNHVTLSWTNQELEMTCNGSPVYRQSYGLPIHLQGHPRDRIWFMPDDFWRVRSQWHTELDEVQVFATAIDEVEAHRLFLRHRPPPQLDDAKATVPFLQHPVRLDGRLEKTEWQDASRVPVMTSAHSRRLYCRSQAWAMVKRDDKTLYVAFDIDTPSQPVPSGTPGKYSQEIYRGDEAELVAAAPRGFRQYFIAPNGAWACRDEMGGWIPEHAAYRHAASFRDGGWCAELAIPIDELEWKEGILRCNFGLHRASDPDIADRQDRWIAWNATQNTELFARNFGTLATSSSVTRIESLGNCGEGRYSFDGTPNAVLNVKNLLDGREVARLSPGQKGEYSTPGLYRLAVTMPNLFWSGDAEVTELLSLQCVCDSDRQCMDFQIQLRKAPGVDAGVQNGSLTIRAEILDSAGQSLFQGTKTVAALRDNLEISFAEPAQGQYTLRATVEGLDKTLSKQLLFTVPDRSFLGNRLGKEDTVPSPWTELQAKDTYVQGAFHRYEFRKGPFPIRAWSQDCQVLKACRGLFARAGGRTLNWQEESASNWRCQGSAMTRNGLLKTVDGLQLDWETILEFDGLLRYRLILRPPKSQLGYRLETLATEFELAENQALAALTPEFSMDWLKKGEASGNLFIGATTNRGFCAFTDDDTNYLHAPGRLPFRLARKDGKVVLRVEFIQGNAILDTPVEYSFSLMATPGKPPRADWRRFHSEGWLAYPGQNWAVRGWTSEKAKMGYLRGYLLSSPLNPAAAKADIAQHAAKGISDVTYTCNNIIPSNNPIHDYFAKAWARPVHGEIQGISQSRDLDGTPYLFGIPVCDNHPGFRDYLCHYVAKNMDELGYKGVYFDFGGDAATDVPSEGRPLPNVLTKDRPIERTNVFGTRELYRRLRNIIKSRHPDGVLYSHSWRVFHPAWMSFTDVVNPGEEFMHSFPRNQDVYAADREFSPPEIWRTLYSSEALGAAVQFLPMLYWLPQLKGYLKMGFAASFPQRMKHSRALLTMCLLHDVQISGGGYAAIDGWWPIQDSLKLDCAIFHGYYDQQEIKAENGALVSYYSWENSDRRLLMVGNLQGSRVQTRLLGLPTNAVLIEPWPTKNTIQAKAMFELEPYGFRILLLE